MISIIGAEQQQKPNSSAGFTLTKICIVFALIKEMRSMRETQLFAANSSSPIGSVIFWHFSFLCRQPAWVALISVRTCFELRAFYTPHLNWYMSAFLLHSSAASARLRVSLCMEARLWRLFLLSRWHYIAGVYSLFVSSPSLSWSRMPIHFPMYFLGNGTSMAQKKHHFLSIAMLSS